MTHIHIYAPPSEPGVIVADCPTCERPRRMLEQRYEWYATTFTCCGCGEQWHGDERAERPFAPGWRRDNIEYARGVLAGIGVQV